MIAVVELNFPAESMRQKILELRQKFVTAGIFLRPFENCVYAMPALNIKRAELKKITDIIFQILSTDL
jgi:adenosylmethionine-8-amino-7-oxononanoate aminotransferase